MAAKRNRYKEMERYMIGALILDLLLFVFYMISAGSGVIWLKVVLSILIILLSGAILAFLYITRELLRPRSLWMTAAAVAIVVCLLFSLVLNFPSPAYTPEGDVSAAYSISSVI